MKISWIIALVSLAACASPPRAGPAAAAPTSAIVFVPGYYGSSLKNARSGERFFITAGRYVFGSDAVSLHTRDLATPKAPDLVVDAVMDRVRVVPGVYSQDVYGRFMKNLERLAHARGATFVPFAYDWRQDLTESAAKLDELIRGLRERGITDVEIVAHSMGCLVTSYYLGYGAQALDEARLDWRGAAKIDRVVLMAGPYRGAFSIFRNMQTGAKIGSNASYMPAETVASMPASYQLLPTLDFNVFDPGGRPTPFAVDAVSTWDRLGLGLLKDRSLAPDVRERRRAFVETQLARARTFADRLEFRGEPAPENLRILQLTGAGFAVVDGAFFDPAVRAFTFDTDRPEKRGLAPRILFRDGDGSVTVRSAQLPEALKARAREVRTRLPHDRVFEDREFWAAFREFSK